MKNAVLIVVGPTASGKSALGVALARTLNGEIVSADSRQVYKGLDIGSGKITKKEMRGVRHHLLDVASPNRKFAAHDFEERAKVAIHMIQSRGKLPIIVGGTGFYIDALTGRIALPDVPPDTALRKKLSKKSAAQLYALLKKKDAIRSKTIDRHNPRRLIRALEIAAALGKNPRPKSIRRYTALWIGISPPAVRLARKIKKRLHQRIKKGMLREGKQLHTGGLSYKRMEELGLEYRSMARHLKGLISGKEMVEELERDIRRYAKKQMSYWRRNPLIKWFQDPASARKYVKSLRDKGSL